MNKQNISKLLVFLIATSIGAVKVYGYAEAEQSVLTDVQPAVAIDKVVATEEGNIDPATGESTGLQTLFSIKTNGGDNDYDFIIKSTILTDGGEVSAYGESGSLLFGNTLATPTQAAIDDAKAGGSDNKNVIAYPVTAVITEPMTVGFEKGYGIHGDCYVVKVNGAAEGTVTHSVGQNPIAGTYNIGQDQAGTYQAVVTFTAVSK